MNNRFSLSKFFLHDVLLNEQLLLYKEVKKIMYVKMAKTFWNYIKYLMTKNVIRKLINLAIVIFPLKWQTWKVF